MRVIAGEAGGRKLQTLRSPDVRPMTDQIKEALFSSLGERVVAARVLDLFAGAGSVGIEALSRGAERVIFVERDRSAAAVIDRNLEVTGFSDRAAVLTEDAETYTERSPDSTFDIVMVDPPFGEGLPSGVIANLRLHGFLAPNAVVIFRFSSRATFPVPDGYHLEKERRYGDSTLWYLEVDR
jgi:16S rRNA (guanine966-N2)-methyltransferase